MKLKVFRNNQLFNPPPAYAGARTLAFKSGSTNINGEPISQDRDGGTFPQTNVFQAAGFPNG